MRHNPFAFIKAFRAVEILAISGGIVAGIVLGAVLCTPYGILKAVGGAILGGIAGLFVGLNVFYGIEAVITGLLKSFTRHKK